MTIPWKVGEIYKDKVGVSYKLIMIVDDPDYVGRPLIFFSGYEEDGKYRTIAVRTIKGCMYLTECSSCYDIIPPEPEVVVSDEVAKAFIEAAYPNSPYDAADLISEMKGIKAALTQYKKELEGK